MGTQPVQNGEIVGTEKTQIIPSSELTGLEGALGELQRAASLLPELKRLADRFAVINTPDEYAAAGNIVTQVRSIKKVGGFKMNPFLEITKRVTEFLRGERTKHESACDAIDVPLSQKMADYTARERAATAREQEREREAQKEAARLKAEEDRKAAEAQAEADRKRRQKEIEDARKAGELNKRDAERLKKESEQRAEAQKEQARKDAEAAAQVVPEVTVQPAIPKVEGIRARVNWKFKIMDEAKIPRKYLTPDEVKIGAFVRSMKDKAATEAAIPGIEVYTEDSV